ncbi:MAG: hypothetical protein HQL14_06765 [Candidatus Omnitrophica bacterium]|nr:hypothetical protein [Candidatus Omnitrophota bacterium]
MPKPKKISFLSKVVEIILVLLISLLIVEVCVRAFLRYHLVYDVEMAKYAMNIVEEGGYRFYKPNISIKVMGVWIHTNADGFRGKDYPVARTHQKRIIFLGSSFLLGWGVKEEDTFHNILESNLSKIYPTQIINTGMINYNTDQETHLFIAKGLKYHPDKVVVFWVGSDVMPTPHKSKWRFLGHSQFITLCWSFSHILAEHLDAAKSYKFYYSGQYKEGAPGLVRAKEAILELKDVCRKNHILLQVVMMPDLHNLANYPFKKGYRMIQGFFRDNGIDVLDVTPFFSKWHDPTALWVSLDDAHPNKIAHQLIAEHTLDFIKKDLY